MTSKVLFAHPLCRLGRNLEDEALMRRLQNGDVQALAVLFERYSRLVLSVATRILRDRSEAQDSLQDVFLYVLRRGSMFDPARGTVASWLLQVTYSKSLNRRNRQISRRRPARVEIDVATRIADPEMCPDRAMEKLSAGRVVRPALAELTDAQRETLRLYFFKGYSLLEASKKRNETLGNTRHHFYRGMAALRLILKSAGRLPVERRKNDQRCGQQDCRHPVDRRQLGAVARPEKLQCLSI